MSLVPFKVYMHQNASDVAFMVLEVLEVGDILTTYSGHWINLGYTGSPWIVLPVPQVVAIQNNHVDRWVELGDRMFTKRTDSGLPPGATSGN